PSRRRTTRRRSKASSKLQAKAPDEPVSGGEAQRRRAHHLLLIFLAIHPLRAAGATAARMRDGCVPLPLFTKDLPSLGRSTPGPRGRRLHSWPCCKGSTT